MATADPFQSLYDSPADPIPSSQAARRTAFRQDPHATLTIGQDTSSGITRDSQLVRKFGPRVTREESKAQDFAHSLYLPVPAIHEVKFSSPNGTLEIVMDFVVGECLEEAWKGMTPPEKQNIARQIREIVSAMRRAAPPADDPRKIGAVLGGPVHDCRIYSSYTGGPFSTEAEFNNDFILPSLLPGTPKLIQKAFADSLTSTNRIVFTHGDISPRNILIKDGQVTALLDWEYAGWYPDYWEYVKFFDRPTDYKDWKDYASVIFETEYAQKLVVHQAFLRWQKP